MFPQTPTLPSIPYWAIYVYYAVVITAVVIVAIKVYSPDAGERETDAVTTKSKFRAQVEAAVIAICAVTALVSVGYALASF